MMEGKPYAATGEDAERRGVAKRRAVYSVVGVATPEQTRAIEAVENGVADGDWGGRDPYEVMRRAEALGVEIREDEQMPNGRWRPVENPDIRLATMQTGAVL